MAFTIGRMITLAAAAPGLLAKADKAGPSLRKLAALAVEGAKLMKDPALLEVAEAAQQLVGDLGLGGEIPQDEACTPKQAIERIAAGEITPEQQRMFDRETQQSGL